MHEAMACGRPSILPNFAGTTELVREDNSYQIPYRLIGAPALNYNCVGRVAYAEIESMAEAMRYCYDNRLEIVLKGLNASRIASIYTNDRMLETLIKIIK